MSSFFREVEKTDCVPAESGPAGSGLRMWVEACHTKKTAAKAQQDDIAAIP